jgi:hypothetical protein
MTSDSTGQVNAWAEIAPYDYHISGTGVTTELRQDEIPQGHGTVTDNTHDAATAIAYTRDTQRALTTAGALHTSFQVNGSEVAHVDKDGDIDGTDFTGTEATFSDDVNCVGVVAGRFGQVSTATTGGAIRMVDGVNFALSVAGVQAALDEVAAAGGGQVRIPSGANILMVTTSVKIGNRVALIGTGDHNTNPTFRCDASTNVTAILENKTQDGTQQYAAVQGIKIDGNQSSGATVGAGIKLRGSFLGTYLKDILVTDCSGNGILLDGGSASVVGCGPFPITNVTVVDCQDDQVFLRGACDGLYFFQLSVEGTVLNKASVKVDRVASATFSGGHCFFGLHFEAPTAAHDGLLLDECANVLVDGLTFDGGATANNCVKITGSTGGSDGSFAAGGHTFRNIRGGMTNIIDDQVASVQVKTAAGRFVRWYASPVASATLDKSQMIGIQSARKGVAIASAATIAPQDGNFFEITGTTNITTITAGTEYSGKVITLQFTNAAPGDIVHGSNIVCRGGANISPAQNDTATLICDGTNWIEVAS